MFSRLKKYYLYDIWNFPISQVSRKKRSIYKIIRTIVLSIEGFIKNKCSFRASSLTYYTLMGIVPFFALLFGIAKGFGYQENIENELLERFEEQKDVLIEFIKFANNLLEQTKGGVIAVIGVIFLFWSLIKLFSHIESSLSIIWNILKPRTWKRKLSNYFALMFIIPIFLVIFSSSKVFLMRLYQNVIVNTPLEGFLAFLLQIVPFILLVALFTFIYVFMPKVKVMFTPALIGGIIAAGIYQFIQWVYIVFQVGVNKYGAIYGSFAALPLFLIWLQLSWLIFLLGSEISYAYQNLESFEYKKICQNLSLDKKMLLCLWITYLCIQNATQNKPPLSKTYFHLELKLPIYLVDQITSILLKCNILVKIDEDSDEETFAVNQYIETLKIQDVIDLINSNGINDLPIQSDSLNIIQTSLDDFHSSISKSEKNILLKDI